MIKMHRDAEYDEWLGQVSAREVEARLRALGVTVVSVKRLAANNNSKNQIYLQPDINDVELPMGDFESHVSTATKRRLTAGPEVIFRAQVDLSWVIPNGYSPAPRANLIHYPQYPETRLSGFLEGALWAPRTLLSGRPGRIFSPDRLMLLGVADAKVFGLVLPSTSPAAKELTARLNPEPFARWTLARTAEVISATELLEDLKGVHELTPLIGCTIDKAGEVVRTVNMNSAGTTLETVLGIRPNARSEPDFHGWELKTHSGPKITLMTPGPTGGYLVEHGIEAFMRRGFGYWSDEKERYDFTGSHTSIRRPGGRAVTHMVVDLESIHLVHNVSGETAMTWSKAKLLDKWIGKHALAAYVSRSGNPITGFRFGPQVGLGEGTSFTRFLDAVDAGIVYFDPALHWTEGGRSQSRHQIRVNRNRVGRLYDRFTENDVRFYAPTRERAYRNLADARVVLPEWVTPVVR